MADQWFDAPRDSYGSSRATNNYYDQQRSIRLVIPIQRLAGEDAGQVLTSSPAFRTGRMSTTASRGGRQIDDEQLADLSARVAAGEAKAQVARYLGVSRETLYRYLG
jgi:transcriptional regulator of acetoin/glycerol metabolism